MPRAPHVPRELQFLPFRGTAAVAAGLLTRRMLDGPTWRRLLPDVYVHRSAELTHRTWCDAVALLLPPEGAIGGLSAAYLWGVNLLPGEAPVTVALPRKCRMRPHPRLSVSHCDLGAEAVTRFGGLPVTTPLRTAFDLGRRPPITEALVAVDALLNRRVVKLEVLRELAAAQRGYRGSRQLREVVEQAEPLAESPMETRLRMLLIQHGLPRPVAQHEVRDDRGRFLARVDLAYPDLLIAIEYEGDHHRERGAFRRDIARVNALRAAGWLVLRFTADDVLRHPGRITEHVRSALRERGHESNVSHLTGRR